MDNDQVGRLIFSLRREKEMTQQQLADLLGITNRAVSKWERGPGSPDIALLPDLSQILGVNIEKILAGNLQPNESDRGNMKNIKFYVCQDCGGVLTSTGPGGNLLLRPQAGEAGSSYAGPGAWFTTGND